MVRRFLNMVPENGFRLSEKITLKIGDLH